MGKSWQQKLEGGKPPHVEVLTKGFGGAPQGGKMLVSQPLEVDHYMRGLPPGTTQTVGDMRDALAKRHRADIACPMSTGIFARIAAEAALDRIAMNVPLDDVTPFWRVINPDSALAKKLSCGPGFIKQQRKREADARASAN